MGATFEDRLLVELTGLLEPEDGTTDRPHRGRVRVGVAAAVVVGGAAAAIVPTVLLGGHGRSAYAVERRSDGTVSLTIHSAIARPMDLQRDLHDAGALARVLPLAYRGACHAGTQNVPTPGGAPASLQDRDTLLIDPTLLPRGTTLVVQVPTDGSKVQPVRVSVSRDGTPTCPH